MPIARLFQYKNAVAPAKGGGKTERAPGAKCECVPIRFFTRENVFASREAFYGGVTTILQARARV